MASWARELEALNQAFSRREQTFLVELASARDALSQARSAAQAAETALAQSEATPDGAQGLAELALLSRQYEAALQQIDAQQQAGAATALQIADLRESVARERAFIAQFQQESSAHTRWQIDKLDAERALLQNLHERAVQFLHERVRLVEEEAAEARRVRDQQQAAQLEQAREAARADEAVFAEKLRLMHVVSVEAEDRVQSMQAVLALRRQEHDEEIDRIQRVLSNERSAAQAKTDELVCAHSAALDHVTESAARQEALIRSQIHQQHIEKLAQAQEVARAEETKFSEELRRSRIAMGQAEDRVLSIRAELALRQQAHCEEINRIQRILADERIAAQAKADALVQAHAAALDQVIGEAARTKATELRLRRQEHGEEIDRIQRVLGDERSFAQANTDALLRAHAAALDQVKSEAARQEAVSRSQIEALRLNLSDARTQLFSQRRAEEAMVLTMQSQGEAFLAETATLHHKLEERAASLRAANLLLSALQAGRDAKVAQAAALTTRLERESLRNQRAVERSLRYRESLSHARKAELAREQEHVVQAAHTQQLKLRLTDGHRDRQGLEGMLAALQAKARKVDEERLRLAARLGSAEALLHQVALLRRSSIGAALHGAVQGELARAQSTAGWPDHSDEVSFLEEYNVNSDVISPAEPLVPAHLQTLLALSGSEFVDTTYRILLGREADPEGRTFFCQRLLEGVGKLQILREFVESPEARAHGASLPGLVPALQHQGAQLGGWRASLLRWFGVSGRDTEVQTRLNRAEAQADVDRLAVRQQTAILVRQMQEIQRLQADTVSRLAAITDDAQRSVIAMNRLGADVAALRTLALGRNIPEHKRSSQRSPLETMAIDERAGVGA